MTTTTPIQLDEPAQSPRLEEARMSFSIPSSRRRQRSPSSSPYTSPHRTGNPITPSWRTPYRVSLTPHRRTPSATTPSGRRNETPDLRSTLRRRYTTLDHRSNTATTTFATTLATTGPTSASSPARMSATRRTQSLVNIDTKSDAAGMLSSTSATAEEPWRREHWVLLSSYYEDMKRDLNGTAEVFYRHESLRSEETDTGRKVIVELWPLHKIKRQVKCLEITARRHGGMPLQDRIEVYEERKRKRVRLELEADLQDDPNESLPPNKSRKTTTDRRQQKDEDATVDKCK